MTAWYVGSAFWCTGFAARFAAHSQPGWAAVMLLCTAVNLACLERYRR